MKLNCLLFASSLLAATAKAHTLEIPEVQSILSEIVSKYEPYVHYDGPTETAKPDLSIVARAAAATPTDPAYFLAGVAHQGYAPYAPTPSAYKVFRNVKDYGAKGAVLPFDIEAEATC